jgi:hypothetical protein
LNADYLIKRGIHTAGHVYRSAWSRSGLSMEIPAPTSTEFIWMFLLYFYHQRRRCSMPCLADDKPKKECCEVAKLLPRPYRIRLENVGLALNSGAGSHDTDKHFWLSLRAKLEYSFTVYLFHFNTIKIHIVYSLLFIPFQVEKLSTLGIQIAASVQIKL